MNPFDLRGPAFLVFFACASVLGIVVMHLTARGALFGNPRSASGDTYRHLRDPYLVAYLRGGFKEALQTVVFSLHERKLLTGSDSRLSSTSSKEALRAIRNPLEMSLLQALATPPRLVQLLNDQRLKAATESYAAPLREAGLVADAAELRRRMPGLLVVGGGLAALSLIKINVALQRGHSNVGFLIILTLLALTVVFVIFRRRRTNAGDAALANQQSLLARLRDRVKRLAADGATNEAVLVAATFGLIALPNQAYPFAAQLRKELARQSSSSGDGSSGCGGGGCGGGGCGGCGG